MVRITRGIGGWLAEKWLGHSAACRTELCAATLKTASGLEFSAHSSPVIAPNSVCTACRPAPEPPVCTSRAAS